MHSSYCGNEDHVNQSGDDCTAYQENLYHPAQYQGTAAHEFGHVFGLRDMYYSATINHGYEPISNEEIVYNDTYGTFALPQTVGIMIRSGCACANDIEMLLLAFCENTWQYYVPYSTNQISSKAIKCPVEYKHFFEDRTLDSLIYVWDDDSKDFIQ